MKRHYLSALSSVLSVFFSPLYSATSRRTSLFPFCSHFSALSLLSSAFILASCQQTTLEGPDSRDMVNVRVALSGLDITTALTRASDKSATEAKVTNIDFKALDAEGNAVATISQLSTDADFGTLTMRLPVGTYSFVAVANDASSAVTITSATEASLENLNSPTLYSCVQSVSISGNSTQEVILDMGKRKNTAFRIKVTDTTPDNVDALQLIIAPTATAVGTIAFSPTTGFASSAYRYEKTYTKEAYNLTTFTNKTIGYYFLLTADEQQIDVTINALSAEDPETHQRTTLYTRTLQGVTFKQANQTTASGTFFSSQSAGSLLFDTTITNSYISLD